MSSQAEAYSRQALKQHIIDKSVFDIKKCTCSEKDKNITSFGVPYMPEKADMMKGYFAQLETLFRKHVNRTIRSVDIEVASDAYELAKDMRMHLPETWLYLRSVNTITDFNRSFIEDTQNYILYGERTCSISSWCLLIDWETTTYTNKRPNKLISDGALLSDPSPDMVDLWVKHETGLNDMLYTIYALFCGNPLRV